MIWYMGSFVPDRDLSGTNGFFHDFHGFSRLYGALEPSAMINQSCSCSAAPSGASQPLASQSTCQSDICQYTAWKLPLQIYTYMFIYTFICV